MKPNTPTATTQAISAEYFTLAYRRHEHQQIEHQVQEFLARGGKITQLEAGMQAIPTDDWTGLTINPKKSPRHMRKRTCSN